MSVFTLKVFALSSMIIDHLGEVLYQRNFPSWDMYVFMRALGRFAFTIYAFLLVNGFQKTSNRARYLNRLLIFAVVSEIPHTLVFSSANYGVSDHSLMAIGLNHPWPYYLVFMCLVMLVYCLYIFPPKSLTENHGHISTYIWPVLYLVVGGMNLTLHGYELLDPYRSIFYTLSLGLCSMWLLENIIEQKQSLLACILQGAALIWAIVMLQGAADYSYLGLLFIVALYLARNDRYAQIGVIALWCVAQYSQNARPLLYFGFLSIIPIFLYNGKQGKPLKMGFYLMYPLHLLALGLANILF